MKVYYYLIGKKENGPFTFEELKTKRLTSETYIWYDGLNDWEKIRNYPELCQELNVQNVPPPLPNDLKSNIVYEISRPIGNAFIVKKGGQILRFAILTILFLIFLSGWVLISVSAKIHQDKLAWYIGLPISVMAALAFNYFKKKWAKNNEGKEISSKEKENKLGQVNTTPAIIFTIIVIALCILLFQYL